MDISSFPSIARQTCSECKASKKRCDKLIPMCSRCSRLALNCSYTEGDILDRIEAGQEPRDAKFDEIFRRLDAIEAHVFSQNQSAAGIQDGQQSPEETLTEEANGNVHSHAWSLTPEHLRTESREDILRGIVLRVLTDNSTTVEAVINRYYEHTHHWLPIIPREKAERELQKFNELHPQLGFSLLIMALHLIVTPYSQHPQSRIVSESPWYRTCKYHFAQYVTLTGPLLDTIQAGMLIALFEHTQGLTQEALLTLGICARLAYVMNLEDNVAGEYYQRADKISLEEEEMVLTWWGLILLERYFNMPPIEVPHQPAIHQKPFQLSFLEPGLANYPSATSFSYTDPELVKKFMLELEASRIVAQVQVSLRASRRDNSVSLGGTELIMSNINELLDKLGAHQEGTGHWDGMAVTLGAALQFQYVCYQKTEGETSELLASIRSIIEQFNSLITQRRIINGFSEIDVPPSWISVSYLAVRACQLLATNGIPNAMEDLEMDQFMGLLEVFAPRYKLAEQCLHLIQSYN
ncbi:hypothetical protein CC78DRAFT_24336 [Lojkania enalia]|uniref:Zn(2)-C6 fungal-type domain-containing protein n=1 Tax=Lojkania enalia TaxID=147567 RepID=A0A9P4K6X2_9PLEO|nr:hypothetical protein CC78DRAFT_24336 [Didymosphaeria enalia]